MLDKYYQIEESNEAGQTSKGVWYCKTLTFKDSKDLEVKINSINKVLNKFNKELKKQEKEIKK